MNETRALALVGWLAGVMLSVSLQESENKNEMQSRETNCAPQITKIYYTESNGEKRSGMDDGSKKPILAQITL